jgi:hypothetical protein
LDLSKLASDQLGFLFQEFKTPFWWFFLGFPSFPDLKEQTNQSKDFI